MFTKNNLKTIPKKTIIKLNFKIFKTLLKIIPFIKLRIKGFYIKITIKKKYILFYLKLLKYNSSFLFNYLSDISVIDYP